MLLLCHEGEVNSAASDSRESNWALLPPGPASLQATPPPVSPIVSAQTQHVLAPLAASLWTGYNPPSSFSRRDGLNRNNTQRIPPPPPIACIVWAQRQTLQYIDRKPSFLLHLVHMPATSRTKKTEIWIDMDLMSIGAQSWHSLQLGHGPGRVWGALALLHLGEQPAVFSSCQPPKSMPDLRPKHRLT